MRRGLGFLPQRMGRFGGTGIHPDGAVVEMTRGKGSSLTDLGKKLVWAERLTHARFDPLLNSMGMEIDSEIHGALHRGACDNAEFHVPMGELEAAVFTQFRDLFKPTDVIIN